MELSKKKEKRKKENNISLENVVELKYKEAVNYK